MNYNIGKRILLTTISILGFTYLGFAQEKVVAPSKSLEKVADQEAKPTFDYNQYIANNFKYPQEAMEAGIEGRVLVKFVVQIDGTITDAKVTRGQELGHGIPEEAVRVVSNMPKWTPAYAEGIPVKSDFTVPLTLKMADEVQEEKVADTGEIEARPGYDLQAYYASTMRYPRNAIENGTSGKIKVKFTVTETGEIENPRVVEGENIKDGLPEEALRIIKNMPKWIPGTVKGVAVRSFYTVPINFGVDNGSDKKKSPAPPELSSSRKLDTSEVQTYINKEAKPDFDLFKYLDENLRYPKKAYEKGVQGKIMVKFIVNIQGNIENPTIIRGGDLGYGLPEEALRVVQNMPKWIPGKVGRTSVKSYYTMPISFMTSTLDGQTFESTQQQKISNSYIADINRVQERLDSDPNPDYNVQKYLLKNLRYPDEALKKKVEGGIILQFTVTDQGAIEQVKVIRGEELGNGLPEEAIRLVENMPKWIPGKINGQNARSNGMMAVNFRLP